MLKIRVNRAKHGQIELCLEETDLVSKEFKLLKSVVFSENEGFGRVDGVVVVKTGFFV